MVETKEFGGYLGKHHYEDNAIKIEFGVCGSTTWPCLRIEVPFEEGEEEKMVAVGKLIETLLRQLGIIESHSDDGPVEPEPQIRTGPFDNVAKIGNHGLGHWAAGACYSCGKFQWFGGLCRTCDECKEKGIS